MADFGNSLPSLISIIGVDGSGKTTLSNWLSEEFAVKGVNALLVWSRFRNYLSKPLLAVTRITGHNHYKQIDNTLFGFHDFENLIGYREVFSLLQMIDVNIGAYFYIHRKRNKADVVICERGSWDTLIDVTSDTGLEWLPVSKLGKMYGFMIRKDSCVIWIDRSYEKIITTRPELKNDYKLRRRIEFYNDLALRNKWAVVDNNGTLESAKQQIRDLLHII